MTDTIDVSGPEFSNAVRTVVRVVGSGTARRPTEATLRLRDSVLTIEHPSTSMTLPAKGVLGSDLRVALIYLKELAAAVAKVETATLEWDGRFLKIGRVGVSAIPIERSAVRPIKVPLNASLADILWIELSHSDEEIDAAGLNPRLAAALTRRDRIIGQALKSLEPLGITEESLRAFLDDQIRIRSTK